MTTTEKAMRARLIILAVSGTCFQHVTPRSPNRHPELLVKVLPGEINARPGNTRSRRIQQCLKHCSRSRMNTAVSELLVQVLNEYGSV